MKEHFLLAGEAVCSKPYLYAGCGLEGIYLLNGYELETYDGEEYISITDIEGLHCAIGRHIVTRRKALAPKEIKFLRNTMGLTQADLAERLGNTSQSVARWEKGECDIPGASEKLLRAIFLASLMTDDELVALREFLSKKLNELDAMDEFQSPRAQFELFDHWTEKPAA